MTSIRWKLPQAPRLRHGSRTRWRRDMLSGCHGHRRLSISTHVEVLAGADARPDRRLLLAADPASRSAERAGRGGSRRCSRRSPTRCGCGCSRWWPRTRTARPASATSTTPSTCPSRRSATTSRCCTRSGCSTASKRGVWVYYRVNAARPARPRRPARRRRARDARSRAARRRRARRHRLPRRRRDRLRHRRHAALARTTSACSCWRTASSPAPRWSR